MITSSYNPDVLSCLANLSSDEVFTPPSLANEMLDLLPAELWSNMDAKFLDPVCKSGVFLREIAKRLLKGLENKIPDLQKRIDHIFHNQIYGIAITELTGLLARRSVYCSKKADGEYSISEFNSENGNIVFERIEHVWNDGKCDLCGANKGEYARGGDLETHAYQFIHTLKPEGIFEMKFDVIIGNPPYQLSTAGDDNGAQAKPLYHLFIEQAKKLDPDYLVMIVPSRWFSGGWGLDDFRSKMLSDRRIRALHDYPTASDCFPGVEIKGGVCYFLWDKSYNGMTEFFSHSGYEITSVAKRYLKETDADILIRYNEAIPILRKVRSFKEKTFETLVSTKKPFGFTTNYVGASSPFPDSVKLYANRKIGYVDKKSIERRADEVGMHKIIVPKAVGSGDSKTDVIKPLYSEPGSCCTETYLLVGPFSSERECENVTSYIGTRFFHFMVTLQKNTQDCMKRVYSFAPVQDFSKPWTDEELYKKYQLTKKEIEFIEAMVWPERED